jgi:hypothetical protein
MNRGETELGVVCKYLVMRELQEINHEMLTSVQERILLQARILVDCRRLPIRGSALP